MIRNKNNYGEESEKVNPESVNPLIMILGAIVIFSAIFLIFKEIYNNSLQSSTEISDTSDQISEPSGYGATDDGIYYEIYEDHIRVFKYYNSFYPLDLVIPAYIEDLPVTEIAYYCFSFSGLNSITFQNPNCIIMDDGETPPIGQDIIIRGYIGSEAQKYSEKFGNKFEPIY